MPASKDKKPESSSASRHVNNLLHTLRGEQFRHAQNLQGSKAHLKRLYSHSYNNPTLPFDQIYDTVQTNPEHIVRRDAPPSIMRVGPQGILEYAYPNGEVPGPGPPRSWSALFGKGKGKEADEATCRADALSLIFSHQPEGIGSSWAHTDGARPSAVPPLMQLCLRVLLGYYTGPAFAEELVPCLPSHLRRNLLRWTAVHSPLPTSKLYALCAPDGHVDGELIVVGPQASLHRDFLKADTSLHRPRVGADISSDGDDGDDDDDDDLEDDWSWDSPEAHANAPSPVHTLILFSVELPAITLLAFPPTLTHVALLALPASAPIYRLPHICPLVEVLDLSFNSWLGGESDKVLDRVEWRRWGRLKVLGLRDCGVGADIVGRVNDGRWLDVDIIGV